MELVRAALLIPVIIVLVAGLPLFYITIPLTAQGERAAARLCGLDVSSARPVGTPGWPWLVRRVTSAGFWKQDLPMVVIGLVMSLGSFVIAVSGLSTAAVLALVPWHTTPENPTTIVLGVWATTQTDGTRMGWAVVLALVLLALTWLLLWGTGALRMLLVRALSGQSEEERLSRANAALSAEVGHLAAGRATLVDAFDAERARIERDLHDGVQQDLVAVTMSIGAVRMQLQALATGAQDDGDGTARAALLAGPTPPRSAPRLPCAPCGRPSTASAPRCSRREVWPRRCVTWPGAPLCPLPSACVARRLLARLSARLLPQPCTSRSRRR